MAPDQDIQPQDRADVKHAPVSSSGTAAVLRGMEIMPDKRLPHLDRGAVQAFAARPQGTPGTANQYALVCENHLTPRTRLAPRFMGIVSPSLAKLIGHGVVYWPPAKAQRYIFVYENNLGQPLMASHHEAGLGWNQDKVIQSVIKPLINVMLDLRDADIVHGNIHPANIFDGGTKMVERVILGDCLAAPASFTLPAVFEPIERAMAHHISRGVGSFEDDLYSLGVTLCMLMRTKDPMEGMTDEQIIQEKIQIGSYAALTGKDRFTGGILELLRGLLYDERTQRWTIENVQQWLDGQRLSPKQSARKLKAARPLHFNNERYFRTELLALDLEKNQSEAVQMIDNGNLEQWISRSLEDNLTKARYAQAIESAQEHGRGPGYWDRLLSRVSIALDPEAPIRYRNLKFLPEGFASALVDAIYKKIDFQPFADIINQQLVIYWLNSQHDIKVDVGSLVNRFDSSRAFLRQTSMGYGIERCLYFLSGDCQCLSDQLKGYYVREPEDLIFAYEEIATKPNRPALFIDKHIAAFLSTRDRRVLDPYLPELNAPEFHKRIMANIKILATIQTRSKMDATPALTQWISEMLDPVYERFHDRELRKNIQSRIDKLKSSGDLGKIAALLDDYAVRQQDFLGFKHAMHEYSVLSEIRADLQTKLDRPEKYLRDVSREYAAIISAIISGIIIVVFAFIYLNKGGFI